MREAYLRRLPLVWFVGVSSGRYLARYPVWLVADEPDQLQFAVALDDAQRRLTVNVGVDESSSAKLRRANHSATTPPAALSRPRTRSVQAAMRDVPPTPHGAA